MLRDDRPVARVAAIAASALILALQAPQARADVRWTAPAGCPDGRAFRAAVEKNAGGEVTTGIRVSVRHQDGRWTATVAYRGGSRVLVGDSCAEVFEAAALVVGLTWRELLARPVTTQVPPVPALVPPAPPAPRAPSAPPTIRRVAPAAQPPSSRRRWLVRLDVGPDLGTMADVATSFGASAGIAAQSFSLQVGVDYGFDPLSTSADVPGIRTSARRLTSVGRVCGSLRGLWLCGGVEVGAMMLHAQSDTAQDTGTGWWVAARAGPELRWAVSSDVALTGAVDAVVPLVSPWFTLGDMTLQRSAGVSARAVFGVQAAF